MITVDDGAVGNLELREIFEKHRVRPTIYLTTGTICFDAGFWWRSVKSEHEVQKLKLLENAVRKKLLSNLGLEERKKAVPRQAIPTGFS